MGPAQKKVNGLQPSDEAELIRTVSDIVAKITGVQLGDREATMVKSRLTKRMSDLGITHPQEYLAYLARHRQTESSALVSLLTTHHTYFFREYAQFDYLIAHGLRQVIRAAKAAGRNHLKVWSMACSRGQEVYSLSMFLTHHLKAIDETLTFEILGTDVDSESVSLAKNGVYRWDDVKSIPSIYAAGHWARGVGDISDYVKAKQSIKSTCRFEVQNLLELKSLVRIGEPTFDLIFCRNVFIYFDLEKVKTICGAIHSRLTPGGLFCIGLSETLNNTGLPFSYLGQSIYSKALDHATVDVSKDQVGTKTESRVADKVDSPRAAAAIRVVCVDDSPTVLAILKSILGTQEGFEIVGTAANGLEAAQIAKNVEFDVMTLDIHMPEQNGIDYLRNNLTSSHPPVVMISSVTREDAMLGLQSFALGAVDYVEKPTAATIAERAEEIKTKLRAAYRSRSGQNNRRASRGALDLARSFEKSSKITDPDRRLRVIVGGAASRGKISDVLRQLRAPQPPTVVLFEGVPGIIEVLATQLEIHGNCKTSMMPQDIADFKNGEIYIGDLRSSASSLSPLSIERRTSIMVFSDVSDPGLRLLSSLTGSHLIVEEVAEELPGERKLKPKAAKYVPFTSLLFDSDDYLNKA